MTDNDQSSRVLRIAARTNRGRVRAENQDVCVIDGWAGTGDEQATTRDIRLDRSVLCAAIDGMGGHLGGATAAWLTARHLVAAGSAPSSAEEAHALAQGAHLEVWKAGGGLGMPEMGAAFAAIVARPDGFDVFNVGDCRVYRVAEGVLGQLSVDDSGPGRLDPTRTVLMQSVGGSEPYEMDVHWFTGTYGTGRARFLLASDGLTHADPAAVAAAVALADVEAAAEALINAALDAGAPDNVTTIVIDTWVPTDRPESNG